MTNATLPRFSAMHALARAALAEFGVTGASLKLLRHEYNSTFRVDTAGGRFVLRINRPGAHSAATINSEMLWLQALRKDTELGVPTPVPALDGSFVVAVHDSSSDHPRHAVLLRWQQGRFASDRLSPNNLAAVAQLQAKLHRHAATWLRPAGFQRPRVDTLTNEGKLASIASSPVLGSHPAAADIAHASALVHSLMGAKALAIVKAALAQATRTAAKVESLEGAAVLIHADLHYENFLFEKGGACAIDFDDCGWGSRLYDISMTLWELQDRYDYPSLRDAFFTEYTRHLSVPDDHLELMAGLIQLRRVQMLLGLLQSREDPAFSAYWQESAAEELVAIRAATVS